MTERRKAPALQTLPSHSVGSSPLVGTSEEREGESEEERERKASASASITYSTVAMVPGELWPSVTQ